MPRELRLMMPKYGLTMTEGTIVEWFKKEGERVRQGEPLCVIETEKVTVEMEAPVTGVLQKVTGAEGQDVPCGHVVAFFLADDEVSNSEVTLAGKPRKGGTPKSASAGTVPAGAASPAVPRPANVDISPIALKIASDRGVDVTRIKGTGPGGRITKEDVVKAGEETPVEEGGPQLDALERVPIRGIRKAISERMRLSRQTAAHFTLMAEVDMSQAVKLREELLRIAEEQGRGKPTLNDMIIKAVASALVQHRHINCSALEGHIHVWRQINVGVAVATERGLIVPVIRDADKKSLWEISDASRRLAERARDGTLDIGDVSGGTFTVTNLGAMGIDSFTPIINYPESAILGVGRVAQKPVAIDGEVALRWIVQLSLSIDHRIIDGAPGAQFLSTLKGLLERPGWIGR